MEYRAKVEIEEIQGTSKRIITVDEQIISDNPVSDMEFANAALNEINREPGKTYTVKKITRY